MAVFTSSGWAQGTTVNAFARDAFDNQTGSSVASGTADANGRVSFSGLTDSTRYVATDGSRAVRFRTPDPLSAGSGTLVFDVTRAPYSADPTGVTDAAAAIQAAINDAAVKGGVVWLPPGTFLLNNATLSKIIVPPNMPGLVTVRGAGRDATTIKLTVATRQFLGVDQLNEATIQNLAVEDLTVDAAGTGSGAGAVIFGAEPNQMNFRRLRFRRLDTINVGNLSVGGTGRRNIDIACTTPGINYATLYTIDDIIVEDCNFGRSGGGGNTGVLIQGFTNATKPPAGIIGQPYVASVWIDNIVLRDCHFDSGAVPTSFQTSAGFQVGQDGQCGKVLVENCHTRNTGDVGFEFDSVQELTMIGCTATDSWWEGLYLVNPGGIPNGNVDLQVSRIEFCSFYRYQTPNMTGVIAAATRGFEYGHVVLRGCQSESSRIETITTGTTPPSPYQFRGPVRSVTMRDCKGANRGWTLQPTSNVRTWTPSGINAGLEGTATEVTVDNFTYEIEGTIDAQAFTSITVTAAALMLYRASDLTLSVDRVSWRHNVTIASGAPAFTMRGVDVLSQQTGSIADNFSDVATSLTDYYAADAGSAADLTQSGGFVVPTAPALGVEHRFRWLLSPTPNTVNSVGSAKDWAIGPKFTPGTTLAGVKAGTYLYRDATNRLEAYVADDGLNSSLVLDSVIGGVRANLATTPITRLAAGTAVWPRIKQSGDTVTAELFTAAPTSAGATPTSTATATLTGAARNLFGATKLKQPGIVWTPADVGEQIDDFKSYYMAVLRGTLRGLTPTRSYQNATASVGVYYGNAATGPVSRIDGKLRITDSDFSGLFPATTVTDISLTNPTVNGIGAGVRVERITWASPPAGAAITVGASPFTYTNQDGYPEDVAIYGGTLTTPFVQVTRPGGTAQQVAGTSTEKMLRLAPGDAVTVTFSAAPTMRKVPAL